MFPSLRGQRKQPGGYPKGDGPKFSKLRVLPPFSKASIDDEEVTIADALKAAGYKTGFLGKWYLGFKAVPKQTRQWHEVNVGGGSSGPPSCFHLIKIPLSKMVLKASI